MASTGENDENNESDNKINLMASSVVKDEINWSNVSAESQPSKCGTGKRSVVWEHFTEEIVSAGCARALCKQCKQSFAYRNGFKCAGTSHLKRHIEVCLRLRERAKGQNTPENGVSSNVSNPSKKRSRESFKRTPSEHQDSGMMGQIGASSEQQPASSMRSPIPASNQSLAVTQAPVSPSKEQKIGTNGSRSCEADAVLSFDELEHFPSSEPDTRPVRPTILAWESLKNDKEYCMSVNSVNGARGKAVDIGNLSSRSIVKTKTIGESHEMVQFVDKLVEATMKTSSVDTVNGSLGKGVAIGNLASCSTVKTKTIELLEVGQPGEKPVDVITSPTVSKSIAVQGRVEGFVYVDNFKIPVEYSALYKKIYVEYGHIGTKEATKLSDTALEFFVTNLLKIISEMETKRGEELNEELLEEWERVIKDAEVMEFNIKWLREEFNRIKNQLVSSLGLDEEIKSHKPVMDAMLVKYEGLKAKKGELETELSEVKKQMSETAGKIISDHDAIEEKKTQKTKFLKEPALRIVLT